MGSALLDDATTTAAEASGPVREAGNRYMQTESALRQQAAERVAAHRSRRLADSTAVPSSLPAPRNARSAKIAAAVAQRYAQTQTYHDFLAAEAELAVQQARAAAEVAALNARMLAEAQLDLLHAMHTEAAAEAAAAANDTDSTTATMPEPEPLLWGNSEPLEATPAVDPGKSSRRFQPPQPKARPPRRKIIPGSEQSSNAVPEAQPAPSAASIAQALADGITIRLYKDQTGAARVALNPHTLSSFAPSPAPRIAGEMSSEEALLLDEEIAFRHEPVFEGPAGPAESLPANLIEFPRQLVAARKARPRLAEGPLRAEVEAPPGSGQLRIFEVDQEQISVAPECLVDEEMHTAQWGSILLDSRPKVQAAAIDEEISAPQSSKSRPSTQQLVDIAPFGRRLAASAIDFAFLMAAFALFGATLLWVAPHLPLGGALPLSLARAFTAPGAILSAMPFAVCAFAMLAAIYQALFFVLSTATPGMRAARIALCTFSGENPSRTAVRRRLPAFLLSALPLGFGFLWALLDEERLTWHDRICGIYQRSY